MNLKFISTGVCSPYAVINGEEKMIKYLEKGVLNLKDGDRVFIFTDGFWEYIKNNKFLKIFKNWNGNLKNNIMEFSKSANLKNPEKYGREKSLIAILI
jgi:serine/threonine protein phosphatase PrpC